MAHRRARLTPFGRQLLVDRVLVLGWSAAEAATAAGVSRATCYKWVRRYRSEGEAGLLDRSSRPSRCPHALGPRSERQILRARRRLKRGPHHLAAVLGQPRSTIYGVLRRHGMSRLDHTDRPSGVPIRYERQHPGELVHIDVKKLGRIPDGGGWRMLGRSTETRRRTERSRRGNRLGYDYLHAAVDDRSRVAYVEVKSDERGETCARFLARAAGFFAEQGVKVQAVMTDNALNYRRSAAFLEAMAVLGSRMCRSRRTTRGPTARSSASTGRCLRSGPTSASTARTMSGYVPSADGSASTIGGDLTPRWGAGHRSHGCEQRRWELHLVPSARATSGSG